MPETPAAPGWYPDPWSATGQGERYFDGQLWGSSERPRARHSVPVDVFDPAPGSPVRSRRSWRPAVALLVVFAVVWSYQTYSRTGSTNTSTPVADPAQSRSTVSQLTQRPSPSTEEASAPLGRPGAAPKGTGGFRFVRTQRGDRTTPVAFDPCRPVHYAMNPSGSPRDGRSRPDFVNERARARQCHRQARAPRLLFEDPDEERHAIGRAVHACAGVEGARRVREADLRRADDGIGR